MADETETQTRLRRAKEALAAYQAAENEARKALADAVESTAWARRNYERLFLAEENRERARRINAYNHFTG
jgi:phosphopantetheine adenylyltransferase